MVWNVTWDRGFVVGGDDNRRLTPNFRLREFRRETGSIRVHRELISALQILRVRLGHALAIREVDVDGLGAVVSARSMPKLLQAADSLQAHHLFVDVKKTGRTLHLRISDPERLPEIDLEQALETAFSVTSAFETTGDRFQQVTGNFDGAGLSFGPVQWNFKSKTLPPLFALFRQADEKALSECFTDTLDYEEWLDLLDAPVQEQIDWANGISSGRGGHAVMQPWQGYFHAVGRVEKFRAIMVEQALRKYGARLLDAIRYLQNLKPDIQIDHLRSICSLYDLVVQQGSLNRARDEIERRIRREDPQDQFHLVAIAVEERGRKANPLWRADCVSRRLGILNAVPKTIDGRQRANLNFYMLRDVRIRAARELIDTDVSEQLVRVSEVLATGKTLLG